MIASGETRQRKSARACSVPRPEHGGSTSTRSNTAPSGRGLAASPSSTRTLLACRRFAVCCSRLARVWLRSTASTVPSPPISAARCVVLPPGAAHRSSTRSPACGASARATSIAARDCASERSGAPQRRAVRVERPIEHERLGNLRVAVRRDRCLQQLLRQRVRLADERVRAQRELAWLVVAGQQRARVRGAELLPPQPHDPLRMRVHHCRRRRRLVAERAEQRVADLRARHGAARRLRGHVRRARCAWPARPRRRRPPCRARPTGRGARRGPGARPRAAAGRAVRRAARRAP